MRLTQPRWIPPRGAGPPAKVGMARWTRSSGGFLAGNPAAALIIRAHPGVPMTRSALRRPLRVLPHLALWLLACSCAWSVDLTTQVDVPDDIGLGERLALVAWLGDRKVPVPDPHDLPALRLAYIRRAHPELLVENAA